MIEKDAIVRDQQHRALEVAQPLFQPFQHRQIEMIRRLIEQQQIRRTQQHLCQTQPRLLPAAQVRHGHAQRHLIKPEVLQDVIAQD